MPRIIGGEFKRRHIAPPPDARTSRPWPDRVKEAAFNLLRGWFEDATVLDLFAGIGTIGLEAVSRGSRAVLVERDRRVADILEANVATLGCADRATVLRADALVASTLARAGGPFDIIFVDPPYAMMRDDATRERVMEQVTRCVDILAPKSFLILRTPLDPKRTDHSVTGLDGPEVHRYGHDMHVLLYAPSGSGPAETSESSEGEGGD